MTDVNVMFSDVTSRGMLRLIFEQGERMGEKFNEIANELGTIKSNVISGNATNAAVVVDLKDQIAALQAKLASGELVTAEDLAKADETADAIIAIQTPAPPAEPAAEGEI